jgi:hypothetical protein
LDVCGIGLLAFSGIWLLVIQVLIQVLPVMLLTAATGMGPERPGDSS